jgi:hypothetical protein
MPTYQTIAIIHSSAGLLYFVSDTVVVFNPQEKMAAISIE